MSNIETYKRGQVYHALWYGEFGRRSPRGQPIPSRFLTRCRKLAERDIPIAAEDKPQQPGQDIAYEPYHAFELALALALEDMGLNQTAVAEFVKSRRGAGNLRRRYNAIMQDPKKPFVLVFRLSEINEGNIVSGITTYVGLNYRDEDGAHRDLDQMIRAGERLMFITLNVMAERVTEALREAPETRRGRKS